MRQLNLFSAEVLTLPFSPRAPFVIETAIALRACPKSRRLETWRAAVAKLTEPLLRAGMSREDAISYGYAFRSAVEVALQSLDDDGGGGPGTRQDMPAERARAA